MLRSEKHAKILSVVLTVWFTIAAVDGSDSVTDVKPITHSLEYNYKNQKLIETKIIPDLGGILKDKDHSADEKWEQIRRFIEDGVTVLDVYGYKPRKDIAFTLVIPKIDVRNIDKPRLKEFILEHIVPGKAYDTYPDDDLYGNGNGHKITFRKVDKPQADQWLLNGFPILYKKRLSDNVIAISIDGYLGDRKAPYSKRNIQETNSRYNEPQRLEMRNATTKNEPMPKESKSSPLMSFLISMKTGTKVFQHFVSKSNISRIMDDGPYTILIPSDNGFQRWHPIDWGFYPFSVQEFTESVLRNHFVPSQKPLRMNDIKNVEQLVMRTLGGENVVFQGSPSPTVNNVSIMGDYQLSNGNQIFIISEVLFVSDAIVSRLHQMHKDKETPPLLAFPWFGAQFLSHSFLALERDPRFTQITRYLNNAEIAPHVSGSNYTFFVPDNDAFEKHGFDHLPDEILGSTKGVKMLLHHFIRGRLYDRDLKDGAEFETIGGGSVRITRRPGSNVTINNAKITESEIFVYNLGTMFYLDDVLYSDILREYVSIRSTVSVNTNFEASGQGSVTRRATFTPPSDVEIIPSDFFTEQSGTGDIAGHNEEVDDEVVTPKALPVRSIYDGTK